MAQVTFDTNDPEDIKLMHRMVTAGLLDGENISSTVDLDKAVDSLLSSLGPSISELVIEFMYLTEKAPTTLESVAKSLRLDESKVKSQKMGLGRSVKRVQREFPGFPDIISSEISKTPPHRAVYTMAPEVRSALDRWFQARGRDFREPPPDDPEPATIGAPSVAI